MGRCRYLACVEVVHDVPQLESLQLLPRVLRSAHLGWEGSGSWEGEGARLKKSCERVRGSFGGVRKIEMADKGRGVMAGVVASGRMSRFLGIK